MKTEQTNIRLRVDLKKKCADAVSKGKFPGIHSFSGLVECSLDQSMKQIQEA